MISEIPFANLPILCKQANMDFFILDYEHGGFDYSSMLSILTIANLIHIDCIVRLPNNGRKDIIKILDMGAKGLLLPMTNKKEDIEEVIRYGKYSPLGQRGISTMRAHSLYNPPKIDEYKVKANQEVKIFAQIETYNGVKNIEEILKVDGLDGFMIGPNDLMDDLIQYDLNQPEEIIKVIEKLAKINQKYHKISGIITNNEKYLQAAKKNQYQYISSGSELSILKKGLEEVVKKLKEDMTI